MFSATNLFTSLNNWPSYSFSGKSLECNDRPNTIWYWAVTVHASQFKCLDICLYINDWLQCKNDEKKFGKEGFGYTYLTLFRYWYKIGVLRSKSHQFVLCLLLRNLKNKLTKNHEGFRCIRCFRWSYCHCSGEYFSGV